MPLDFFISYTQADSRWAEWIAWQLEAAGYITVLRAWDRIPGKGWAHEMQRATAEADAIAVLSADYLGALHGEAERRAAFPDDATVEQGRLIPVRVADVDASGMLMTRVAIDLVGMSEHSARARLLEGVRQRRAKPAVGPTFPGRERPEFPPRTAAHSLHDLLLHPPSAFGDIRDPYALGVDREALSAHVERRGYVQRDETQTLTQAMQSASDPRRPSLIVVSGPSKVGKTRLLYEAARVALAEAIVVAPRHAAALGSLMHDGALRGVHEGTIALWLDDIEGFIRLDDSADHHGIDATGLEQLPARWERHVIVLATHGGKGYRDLTGDDAQRLRSPVASLLRRADAYIPVAGRLTATEQERAERKGYSPAAVRQMSDGGVGEYMIAAPELISKLNTGVHPGEAASCKAGVAVVRAAIDWRLAGVPGPIPIEHLQPLHQLYLEGGLPTVQQFESGVDWALEPLYETSRLLSFVPSAISGASKAGFAPHDYVVEETRRTGWQTVADATYAFVLESCSDPRDLFAVGLASHDNERTDRAIAAFRAADAYEHAAAALNLGILLEQAGEVNAALAAYRRADERGSTGGALNLGQVLQLRGDADGAEAAFHRADERGDAAGAFNLGLLLAQRGEIEAAIAAYRRGDERGSPGAATNLGTLLMESGDFEGAEAAFLRASERGSASGSSALAGLRAARGDSDGAREAFARADTKDAWGLMSASAIPTDEASLEGLAPGLLRSAELDLSASDSHPSGSPASRTPPDDATAAYQRGTRAHNRGDLEGSEAELRRAADLGHADAAYMLAAGLKARGRPTGEVEAAYRQAAELGHPSAGLKLDNLIAERDGP